MQNPRTDERRSAFRPQRSARAPSMRLRITMAPCPQVMSQVLSILARQAVTPWVISYSRRPRTQYIEVQTDRLPSNASETLLNSLQGLVHVRSVRMAARTNGTSV